MWKTVRFLVIFVIFNVSPTTSQLSKCNRKIIIVERGSPIYYEGALKPQNEIRQKLIDGKVENQPRARKESMKMLQWDYHLATLATKIANTCTFDRKNVKEFIRLKGFGVNLHRTCSPDKREMKKNVNWGRAVRNWFAEADEYKFSHYFYSLQWAYDQYIQMVLGKDSLVGCSYLKYREARNYCEYIVCLYGPKAIQEGEYPYKRL